MSEWKKAALLVGGFLIVYWVPWDAEPIRRGALEAALFLQEYARRHTLGCLVVALLLAGAINVFVSGQAVISYFGAGARKLVAYPVAAVSGAVLTVCSCTILPLFAGIYARGAGIGPASTFLYAGPAINILAIVLTARVLGWDMGLARAIGAVGFSVVIGLVMERLFGAQDPQPTQPSLASPSAQPSRPLWKEGAFLGGLAGILLASTLLPSGPFKLGMIAVLVAAVVAMALGWYERWEVKAWLSSTWGFAWQILPVLGAGVVVAGFLLGRPGHQGLLPTGWVAQLVGGNSAIANLGAAAAGALMYFSTLTEVPIVQGLMGAGMGKGPALALLLAGPAVSLPNMLVIFRVVGLRRAGVFYMLVIGLSALAGWIFGWLAG